MEGPLSRIVRVHGYGDCRVWRQKNRVAHSAGKARLIADADDLEMVPMQMNGMRHHRLVADLEFDTISLDGRDRAIRRHSPRIPLHAAGQGDNVSARGIARGERLQRPQTVLE